MIYAYTHVRILPVTAMGSINAQNSRKANHGVINNKIVYRARTFVMNRRRKCTSTGLPDIAALFEMQRKKKLEPLRHILPSTTDDQLRECHKLIVPDVPLSDFVMSYREVSGHLPSKEREELNPRDLYQYVCKTECWNALSVALARLLAAKPHSADVGRLISSYNEL